MKKAVSIVLMLAMLLSCVVFVACEFSPIFDDINIVTTTSECDTPDGIIETSITDRNGNEVIISHTDNFTQDDLDFVLMWHGIRLRGNNDPPISPYPIPSPSFEDVIEMVSQHDAPLYLMHFENPYFICSYKKPNMSDYECDEEGYYYTDVTRQVWCKFINEGDILQTFNGMSRVGHIYLLFDCTIKENITNGEKLEWICKYYLPYKNSSYYDIIAEDMLVFYSDKDKVMSAFIEHNNNDHYAVKVYINDEEKQYLYFIHESYYIDGVMYKNYSKELFGNYYEMLSPHFEILEEKLVSEEIKITYAGLDIEVLMNLLFE